MSRRDMFNECYTGEHRKNLTAENFKHTFCRVCRNPGCTLSLVGKSLWVQRMENQADRLLNNPKFADPRDPRYAPFANQDFRDMSRQARTLEVANRTGEWISAESPTNGTPANSTQEDPSRFMASKVAWEGKIRSRGGKRTYTVQLLSEGDQEHWTCTCPGFRFHKRCVHIALGQEEYQAQEAQESKKPQTERRAPARVDPTAWQQMKERGLVPSASNTRYPSGGLMIDGTPPPPPPRAEPEPDPWSLPKPKPETVAPGTRIVLGGKK